MVSSGVPPARPSPGPLAGPLKSSDMDADSPHLPGEMLTRNEEAKHVLSGRSEVVPAAEAETYSTLTSLGARGASQMAAALVAPSLPARGCHQMACPPMLHLNHYIPFISEVRSPGHHPVSRQLAAQASNSPLWLLPI